MLLRETARQIFLQTLDRIKVVDVMERCVRLEAGRLLVGEHAYLLESYSAIRVVSVGKAAVPMAETLMRKLEAGVGAGQALDGMVVGTRLTAHPRLRSFPGGHPLPNLQSLAAAGAVLEYLRACDSRSLVLFLISGGASTMLEMPLEAAMSMETMTSFHRGLVHSGLGIEEMNVLRKHVSAVKGGRLAVAAKESTQCTLLISDVPADKLHVVGSGPTLPDPSTVEDCRRMVSKHGAALGLPEEMGRWLSSASLPETPKEDDDAFRRSAHVAILSSDDLCMEASRVAAELGFHVTVDNTCDEWPYEKAASYLVDRLAGLQRLHGKVCLFSAGEIAVRVGAGGGVGGRNQHFVLECARVADVEGIRVTVLSAGSDGIDGNSPAAGGVGDETTVGRAAEQGLSVSAALERFDSYSLLDALGDTLVIGPSGNNVRDLRILLSSG